MRHLIYFCELLLKVFYAVLRRLSFVCTINYFRHCSWYVLVIGSLRGKLGTLLDLILKATPLAFEVGPVVEHKRGHVLAERLDQLCIGLGGLVHDYWC